MSIISDSLASILKNLGADSRFRFALGETRRVMSFGVSSSDPEEISTISIELVEMDEVALEFAGKRLSLGSALAREKVFVA
jgi:hypothetical protein